MVSRKVWKYGIVCEMSTFVCNVRKANYIFDSLLFEHLFNFLSFTSLKEFYQEIRVEFRLMSMFVRFCHLKL